MKPKCNRFARLLLTFAPLAFAMAMAAAGAEAWVRGYSHPTDSDDQAAKVVADASGNVIVTGYSDDGVHGKNWLTIKYSSSGVPLWTNRYDGPDNGVDVARAVVVDGSGNVFVSGDSAGSGSYSDYATVAYSAAGVPLWTNRYNGPSNSADQVYAMAVDGSGNVFVTGGSAGSGTYSDYATVAYSGAGVPLWTNRYNGPGSGDDRAYGLAVDGSGNVSVTGYSLGSGSHDDYATVAYSGAGVPLWTNRYNGPGNSSDVANAVVVDGSGNVFVTGSSHSGTSSSSSDYATVAYSVAGVPLWTNRYNGPGNSIDGANAVVVDGSGNVFVTGVSYSGSSSSSSDYATVAYSGAGTPLWTNRYNSPGNMEDRAYALTVGGGGNVFVTGYSTGSGSSYDYATVAYSGAGVPLWTNRYNGPDNSDDLASAVAVDGSGNVFVTGKSYGSGSDFDYATVAYSGAGVSLWTNRYNGLANGNDEANAVAVDGSGNIFVTGYSYSGGGSSSSDYATVAYSAAGVPWWTNRYDGPGNNEDQAYAVAVDGSGNVFVTGYSTGSGSSYDYATVAYSGTGVPLWTNRYNGPGNSSDVANAVVVDGSGNVFVTGASYSGSSGSSSDYATVAYSGTGVPLWTNRYNGPGNSSDVANAVVVDGSGNVFVTGYSWRNSTNYDYATVAYSGAGVPLWTNRYNGPGSSFDGANAVAVDGSGNVFVTGYSYGGSSSSSSDYATVAYSGAGVPLWTNRYNGPGNDNDGAFAVAVDGSGNVFVTGYSAGSGSDSDYATVAYSGAGVPLWTNRYNGPGNSSDVANAVVVDGSGNVFVTGYSYSAGSSSFSDYATVAYSGAGVPLWTNRYNGPGNGDDRVRTKYSLAIAPDGLVVAGYSDVAPSPDVAIYNYSVLKYLTTPSITGQPQNVSVGCGSGLADFSVTATSVQSLAYQWYFKGAPIAGATASNYVVNPTTPATAGSYTVVVTNAYGAATSSVATLTLTNYTPTMLAADAFSLSPGGSLHVASLTLTANDTAGSCDGNGTTLDLLAVSSTSANGGVVQFAPFGQPLWTNRYTSPGSNDDWPFALAVDGNGNVFVTGYSFGTANDFATVAYSGTGAPLWTNLYNGPGNSSDQAHAVAVDGSGNVFVTGSSTGSGGSPDYATVAYSGTGAPLWTNRYDGPGSSFDGANAVAVDGSGNVFVTGYSSGNGSSYDYATVAYSAAGVPLWTNRYNGPGGSIEFARAVAVDGSGNVFVTGYSIGTGAYSDYLTVAYSGAGVPMWTNRYDGPGNGADVASAVAVDGSGNVFVSGSATGSGSSYDYATVAYSGAGVPLWTNRYNGPYNNEDHALAMAVDGAGNIFVSGYSAAGIGIAADYATVAYSGAGVPLWTNRYDGPGNLFDQANAVAVDAGGNVIVTGYSTGSGGSYDYATVAYSGAGVPLWTNRYNGSGNGDDQANAVRVDGAGNVFVTGYSKGVSSLMDFVTIGYSGGQVTYTPPNGFTGVDAFTYVMQDGYGLTYTGTVSVAVGVVANVITAMQAPGGEVQLGYYGLPGRLYVLERTLNLAPAAWSPQQTNAAAANGALTFTYLPVGNSTFWRIRSAP